MYYVIYLHEGIHVAIHVLCNISVWRWGGGGQGGHNLHMGSRLHPMNVNSTKSPENTKKLDLVKWVTRNVLHSCSDLSCFGFLGFLYGFVLLWGSPFGLFGFCCFLNGFHEFSLCSSMLSCLGQREGPRSWSGPQIRAPANILLWLAEGGNTCLKEVRDVRDDSKALIRTIAYCLNTNARLRPLPYFMLCHTTIKKCKRHTGLLSARDHIYIYIQTIHAICKLYIFIIESIDT